LAKIRAKIVFDNELSKKFYHEFYLKNSKLSSRHLFSEIP